MDDLTGEFINETADAMEALAPQLAKLKKDPADARVLGDVFSLMQTIKGTCSFLHLPRLESVADAAKQMLSTLRDETVAPSKKTTALILDALESIRSLLLALEESGKEPAGDDRELLAQLRQFGAAVELGVEVGETSAPAMPADAPLMAQLVGELVNVRNQLVNLARAQGDEAWGEALQPLHTVTTLLQHHVGGVQQSQALIVEVGGKRFALPQYHVQQVLHCAGESSHRIETIERQKVIRLDGTLLPVMMLATELEMPSKTADYVAVCRAGGKEFALAVERIEDMEDIVLRPMPDFLRNSPLYSGEAQRSDGSVVMLLNAESLARRITFTAPAVKTAPKPAAKPANTSTDFLLFDGGSELAKALPINRVARVEELDAGQIEQIDGIDTISHRGALLRLVTLDGIALPSSGKIHMVVLAHNGHKLGLAVKKILDIAQAPEGFNLTGMAMLGGRAVEVIDVPELLGQHQAA